MIRGSASTCDTLARMVVLLLALALAGCGGRAISGIDPSYVRATDELRGVSFTSTAGEVVDVFGALARGAALWDVAGAHVRAIGSDDPADGPVVRAEMATQTELAIDSNEGDTANVVAYYSGTLHVIRTPWTLPAGDARAGDEMRVIYAHEIGHAMGLPHLPDGQTGIMSPAPSNRLQGPTQDDLDLFRSIWPR